MFDTIREAIVDVITASKVEYPSTPIIYAYGSASPPSQTYICYSITTTDQVGKAERSDYLTDDFDAEYFVPYHVLANVQVVGNGSYDIAFSLFNRLKNSNRTREALEPHKMSIIDKTSPTQRYYKDGNKYIHYTTFDLRFYFINRFTDSEQPVESVVVEDVNESITFTIPPT